jgi:hypothetical protein
MASICIHAIDSLLPVVTATNTPIWFVPAYINDQELEATAQSSQLHAPTCPLKGVVAGAFAVLLLIPVPTRPRKPICLLKLLRCLRSHYFLYPSSPLLRALGEKSPRNLQRQHLRLFTRGLGPFSANEASISLTRFFITTALRTVCKPGTGTYIYPDDG